MNSKSMCINIFSNNLDSRKNKYVTIQPKMLYLFMLTLYSNVRQLEVK